LAKLGFDIDDTIADSFSYYLPLLNEKFNKNITVNDVNGRLSDVYDIPKSLMDEFFKNFGNEIFEDLSPFPKSVETINKWYDEGHEIIIITARPLTAVERTKIWLKQNGIKYHELYFDEEKSNLAKDLNLNAFVDDYPKVVESMHKVGITTIFMDLPKNRKNSTSEGIIRVKDWNEVESTIEGLLK
jgi:uncharacterized HAD superfamily protein